MNDTAIVVRSGPAGWRTAAWVVGSAAGAAALADAVFLAAIVVAEASALVFGLTEQAGVPVFTAIIAVAVIVYGVLLHVIVRMMGRSAEVPWVIWPAMAFLPTVWVFIVLASGSGVFEPLLAVMQLVGIGIAFATLGERRWTKG